MFQETKEERDKRMKWWRDATFGMFIHWGLYSILGRGEWVMNRENIPVAEYEKLAASFNPRHYDPQGWARLAREAGMKYMVLTAKHHEGFCLWDSQLTDFTSVKTVAGRDFVRDYVEACRNEGLKVGLYFSLIDWHHPDGDNRGLEDEVIRCRFIAYVHGQVRELLSNYGTIDILWYDVSWPYEAEGWESEKLDIMARSLQPEIIINNRAKIEGDFGTPEGHVKAEAAGRDWEACMTLNDNWGYHRGDHNWKNAHEVIKLLGECSRGGGNLLLNVGPDQDGVIPEKSQEILREVGDWLKRNGKAIYNSNRAMVGWGNFGLMTVKGTTLFLLIDKWNGNSFTLGRVTGKVLAARMLATGTPVTMRQDSSRIFLTDLPETMPDLPFTVIVLDFEDVPLLGSGPSCVWPTYAWGDPLKSPTGGKDD